MSTNPEIPDATPDWARGAVIGQGPTIHSVVMDDRTTDLFVLIEKVVKRDVDEFAMRFIAEQEVAIRQAYLRGVRDGFQQGALAAQTSTSDPDA